MSKGARSEPCIRGSEPRMHTHPYEARHRQAKARARAWGLRHASEAASLGFIHRHTRRGIAKPRRERGREA
jgi:hypothetical protein